MLPLSSDIRFSSFANFVLNSNPDFTFKASDTQSVASNQCTLQSKSQKTNFTFFTPGLSEYAFDPLSLTEAISACHSILLLIDCSEEMVRPLIDDVCNHFLSYKTSLTHRHYRLEAISSNY